MAVVVGQALQVCQLTKLKQTKEWERYPNWFHHLYKTLPSENVGKHCGEWPAGKMESEIKLLTQENSKTSQCTLMAESSKTSHGGASPSNKLRPPFLKTVQPIQSQPPAWQWRWKQSPMPSTGLSQEVTDNTCHLSHSLVCAQSTGTVISGRLVEEGDYNYTYRSTVTSRMTSALRWVAIRAILMFH